MVCAGTGVDQFRAFIQERARLKPVGRQVGPMKLFYGCQRATEDLLPRRARQLAGRIRRQPASGDGLLARDARTEGVCPRSHPGGFPERLRIVDES